MSKTPFEPAPEGRLLHSTERNKLIAMSVLVVLIIVVFSYTQMQEANRAERDLDQIAEADESEFQERLVIPSFDASLITGKILDAREGDRVLLQRETLNPLLEYTSSFHAVHFLALGMEDLDAAAQAALAADPEAHRARPYLARGWLDDRDQRVGADGADEHHGRLRLEDGSFCHFVVRAMPDSLIMDDFVRLDGLFLKLFRSEGEEGWLEGPLLVGSRLVPSWPQPEKLDPDAIAFKLAQITDDTIGGGLTGLSGEVFDAQWLLMNKLVREGDAEIDWENVPELNDEMLVKIMTEGPAWRGVPIRIPISRNLDLWTSAPGENPARVHKLTKGWIGSWTWGNNKSAVLHYVMPFDAEHLRGTKLIFARGYFLKNFAYEMRDGNLRVAPYFVLSEIEEFLPPVDNTRLYFGIGLSVLTILMISLIYLGLRHDKKRAASFQADMVRRRRARRERAQASETE